MPNKTSSRARQVRRSDTSWNDRNVPVSMKEERFVSSSRLPTFPISAMLLKRSLSSGLSTFIERAPPKVLDCFRDERNDSIPPLSAPLLLNRGRCDPAPRSRAGNQKNELLRDEDNRVAGTRLRSSPPEVKPGSAMLRGVPVWTLPFRYCGRTVRLSSRRRRIVCCFHCFRAHPLATSTGSTPPRLGPFQASAHSAIG